MAKAIKAALAAIGLVAAMSAQAGGYGLDTACTITTAGGPVQSSIGSQFSYLREQIKLGVFTNERDRTGMNGKLDEATNKVLANKMADASVKLQAIHDKADDLASAAKPKLKGADAIMEAALLAKECVDNPTNP